MQSVIRSEVPSVYRHYTVEEMLPWSSNHNYPLAVGDEESKRLLGIVTQTSLIIEATRYEREEIKELIEKANDI